MSFLCGQNLADIFPYLHIVDNDLNRCPYDFVYRNSTTLVITIGDSWTYGSDVYWASGLTREESDFLPERVSLCYGNLISQEINADFLNLGQCGSCNITIGFKIQQLDKIMAKLEYDKVYVVCTFTEAARSIEGWGASPEKYAIEFCKDRTLDNKTDFYELLAYNNGFLQQDIVDFDKKYSNVVLLVGNNFTDPIGMHKELPLLARTWVDLMCERVVKCEYTGPCYVMSHWIIDQLPGAIAYLTGGKADRSAAMQWSIDLLMAAEKRLLLLDDRYYRGVHHPTGVGHEVWANYILENM